MMEVLHTFSPLFRFLGWLLLAIVIGVTVLGVGTYLVNLKNSK